MYTQLVGLREVPDGYRHTLMANANYSIVLIDLYILSSLSSLTGNPITLRHTLLHHIYSELCSSEIFIGVSAVYLIFYIKGMTG